MVNNDVTVYTVCSLDAPSHILDRYVSVPVMYAAGIEYYYRYSYSGNTDYEYYIVKGLHDEDLCALTLGGHIIDTITDKSFSIEVRKILYRRDI